VEVVELSPKLKDEDGNEIAGSEKPLPQPKKNDMVEIKPVNNRIAHRELKVKIGEALKGKKITWTMTPYGLEKTDPIRGDWAKSLNHKDRFEVSADFGANGFKRLSQQSGETTIADDGFTAVRVNLPPVGFNKCDVKMKIEGVDQEIELITLEVPAVAVIDPGHGGNPGDSLPGSSWNNATGINSKVLEKDLALEFGLKTKDLIEMQAKQDDLNIKVLMTRKGNQNVSGADRAAKARDSGADTIFIIHLNAFNNPTVRGTLQVKRTRNNHNAAEDSEFISRVIDKVVAAIKPFDAGANKRFPVSVNTSVASDQNLGNVAGYSPIRAGYCEVEFITHPGVDNLINIGANSGNVKTAISEGMKDGIIEDLKEQP